MAATSTRPELTVIEDPLTGFDGELTEDNIPALVTRIRELDDRRLRAEQLLEVAEGKVEGLKDEVTSLAARLREIKKDKEKKARASGTWPIAERLFVIWKNGTGNTNPRSKLTYKRFEFIEPFIRDCEREQLSYEAGPPTNRTEECAAAIVGRITDHFSTKRSNGSTKHFWEWERIFKNDKEFDESCSRRPRNWRELLEQWDEGPR